MATKRARVLTNADGQAEFGWDDTVDAPPSYRHVNSPWAALWAKIDRLEIQTTDQQVGQQHVKAGFSAWVAVRTNSTEHAKSAQSSATGWAQRFTDRWRLQSHTDGTTLWLRKVVPSCWGDRFSK